MRFMLLLLQLMLACVAHTLSLRLKTIDTDPRSKLNSIEPQSIRSENTCADPSLARVLYQAYSALDSAHSLHFLFVFADADSISTAPYLWMIQGGGAFQAWATQQPFTVPLFRLIQSNGQNLDIVFLVGVDAQTPPTLSGFQVDVIVAWVYNSPVCGSVPLMSAALASRTDHYYTTDSDEHAGLLTLSSGWKDNGIVAYVLPM